MTPTRHVLAAILASAVALGTAVAPAAAEARKPNRLLGIQSPYLQQHIYNVVDWYPWGEEALEKARREDKPILLSVGYSTCHWCHVMARESFDDETIGRFLNQYFVSIKIDRERRPDLDEQFMLATEALTGRGGWPNTVFLTSGAKPFYAATYLPPDVFLSVAQQIEALWESDRESIEQEGERIAAGIMDFMNRTEAARSLTPEAVGEAAAAIIARADAVHGGLGSAPKFPQEAALLLLLDQAERGNGEALEVVKHTLDGMLTGGIHDHVGGGFHRYSVTEDWLVPHFEKMLYTQALTGRLLVKTFELTGEYRYRHTAIRLFDYVVREMQDAKGGFYSAQDADSLGASGEEGEGLFYIWSKDELDRQSDPRLLPVRRFFPVTEAGNFEGENILALEARVDQLAKAGGLAEESLYAEIDAGLDYLRTVREETRHPPHKDEKIVVSWNAMMIETMAHAAFVLDRPDYWMAAKASADYIVNTMLNEDGLKRISFQGDIGVEGQLADHAGLGTALLALQDFTPEGEARPDYTAVVIRLADDVRARFADRTELEARAFRMTREADGLGSFPPLDDNPIPSGNSLALKLFSAIAAREGDPEFRKRADVLNATLSGFALANPLMRGTLVKTAFGISDDPTGTVRHAANGNVRAAFRLNRDAGRFSIGIEMKDGWHINSNRPLETYFVPTVLSVDGAPVAGDGYPAPLEKTLRFNDKPLSLYEGSLVLSDAYAPAGSGEPRSVALEIQACSDEICLEPETLTFHFWADQGDPREDGRAK